MVRLVPDPVVLKVTVSPTERLLSVASPFLSMSLEDVTAYVVVPELVLMVTLLVPTAVTVPLKGSVRAPPGPPAPGDHVPEPEGAPAGAVAFEPEDAEPEDAEPEDAEVDEDEEAASAMPRPPRTRPAVRPVAAAADAIVHRRRREGSCIGGFLSLGPRNGALSRVRAPPQRALRARPEVTAIAVRFLRARRRRP